MENSSTNLIHSSQLNLIISEVPNNSNQHVRILENTNWPGNICHIHKPPKQLFIRGTMPWLSSEAQTWQHPTLICIIGARKCTRYGREITRKLVRELIQYNVVIVSGLALGIDSEAHSAALSYGLPTIAFPGSGLASNIIYPRLHAELAEKIVESGGALISEYSEHTAAQSWMFPMRNRLMAAASSIVVVVEAEETSGTRTTVDSALAIGTPVGAIPGPLLAPLSIGTNALIQSGAHLISSGKDIAEITHALKKTDSLSNSKPQDVISHSTLQKLSQEQIILSALASASYSPASLAHKINIPINEVVQILTKLCIQGHINLGTDGLYHL